MRSSRATILVALGAVLTTLLLGASPSPSRTPAAAATSRAPSGLIKGLKDLDTHINGVIEKVQHGALNDKEYETAVQSLSHSYEHLLITYFPKVWGLSFASVFFGFANIDAHLANAEAWANKGNEKEAARAIDFDAKASQEGLSSDLRNAQGVPKALLDGLDTLGMNLEHTGKQARSGALKGAALRGAVNKLEAEKHGLIKDNSQDVPIFGQPFNTEYLLLEKIHIEFRQLVEGVPFGHHLRRKVPRLDRLRAAKASKQTFEATVVPPGVGRIQAQFFPKGSPGACDNSTSNPNYGETCYGVVVDNLTSGSHDWGLIPPFQDTNCKLLIDLQDPPESFVSVWHHGDEDGCNHGVESQTYGHLGTVWFSWTNAYWTCVDVFFGTSTNTNPGGPLPICAPSKEAALVVVKTGAGPSGAGNGTVTSAPAGIVCGAPCSSAGASFPRGSQVTLGVTPDGSSTFMGWAGCDQISSGSCVETMAGPRVVMATFQSN